MCAFNNPIVFNCGYMQLILFERKIHWSHYVIRQKYIKIKKQSLLSLLPPLLDSK